MRLSVVKHGASLLTNSQGVITWSYLQELQLWKSCRFSVLVVKSADTFAGFLQIPISYYVCRPPEDSLLMALIEPQLTFVGIFLTNVLWDYFFVARKCVNTESPRIMRFQFCVVHIVSFWKFKNGLSIGMYVPWLHF